MLRNRPLFREVKFRYRDDIFDVLLVLSLYALKAIVRAFELVGEFTIGARAPYAVADKKERQKPKRFQ
jgi:hypothetical protein